MDLADINRLFLLADFDAVFVNSGDGKAAFGIEYTPCAISIFAMN